MTTTTTPRGTGRPSRQGIRTIRPYRHLVLPRAVAGVPLLGIGLSHVFVPDAPMRPLVEAAGFPLPGLVSPLGVAALIAAGFSLLAGLWARTGAVLAIPTMVGAVYAHLVIDVWPNGAENEPPLALPITVLLAAVYVLCRGAGRWSLDQRIATSRVRESPR